MAESDRRCRAVPRGMALIICTTLVQAKKVFQQQLKDLAHALPNGVIDTRKGRNYYNSQTGTLKYNNGACIQLAGISDVDSIRGAGAFIIFAAMDELAFCAEEAWDIVSPVLEDHEAPALLSSSPWGTNFFKTLYDRGDPTHPTYLPDWGCFHWTILDNEGIPHRQRVWDRKKKELQHNMVVFNREWAAEWEGSSLRVFPTFDRKIHVTENADFKVGGRWLKWAIHDFGYNHSYAGFLYTDMQLGNVCLYDECVFKQEDATVQGPYMARRQQKEGIKVVYVDSAGKAHGQNISASCIDIFAMYGVKNIIAVPKAKEDKRDYNDLIRRHLRGTDGKPHFFIHPRCKHTIECFERLEFVEKDQNNIWENYRKDTGHDHAIDALRYGFKGFKDLKTTRVGSSIDKA